MSVLVLRAPGEKMSLNGKDIWEQETVSEYNHSALHYSISISPAWTQGMLAKSNRGKWGLSLRIKFIKLCCSRLCHLERHKELSGRWLSSSHLQTFSPNRNAQQISAFRVIWSTLKLLKAQRSVSTFDQDRGQVKNNPRESNGINKSEIIHWNDQTSLTLSVCRFLIFPNPPQFLTWNISETIC